MFINKDWAEFLIFYFFWCLFPNSDIKTGVFCEHMFIHPFAVYSVLPPIPCRIMQSPRPHLQVPIPVFTPDMFQTPPNTIFPTDNRYQDNAMPKKSHKRIKEGVAKL